jgi:hypothetical protein
MRSGFSAVLSALLFLLPLFSFSQLHSGRLNDLYKYVEKTDSLADKTQKTFQLEKFLKDNYNYKETWRYTMDGSKVVFFQVDYMLDSTEFTEVYYLNKGHLICSEEYEKINYSYEEDELKFGGIYYFFSSTPRHVVTLGSKNLNNNFTSPQFLALDRFGKRFSELKQHMPMLP